MEIYAFWLGSLVVIPLTLQALAGPIVLKQYGLRAAVPVAALLWLAPIAVLMNVSSVPEILVWVFPFDGNPVAPPIEALLCLALAVWLALGGIWLAARYKTSLIAQSVISAAVSSRNSPARASRRKRRRANGKKLMPMQRSRVHGQAMQPCFTQTRNSDLGTRGSILLT